MTKVNILGFKDQAEEPFVLDLNGTPKVSQKI